MGAPWFDDAADIFDPLAGSYVGVIEPGTFVEHVVRKGNRHGALGLRLDIGESGQRVVRCGFLLGSEAAIGVAKRDTEILAEWARLVEATPARDWFGLVKNLWIGQQRLGADLSFDIRASARGRGYILNTVKMAF